MSYYYTVFDAIKDVPLITLYHAKHTSHSVLFFVVPIVLVVVVTLICWRVKVTEKKTDHVTSDDIINQDQTQFYTPPGQYNQQPKL